MAKALAHHRLSALAVLALCCGGAVGQTASPDTPPPKFPAAVAFDPKAHPVSERQHQAMVRMRTAGGGGHRLSEHAITAPAR